MASEQRAWRTRWTRPQPANGSVLPRMDHASKADFEKVYEPADDTYLFVDVIRSLSQFIKTEVFENNEALLCVEVGSGSGMLSATWAEEFSNFSSYSLAVDINVAACQLTSRTFDQFEFCRKSDVLCADLISSLRDDSVDVLLFNPPYVTTPSEEVGGHDISAAWAGGRLGREVLDRLIPMFEHKMRRPSLLMILASEENRPDEIAAKLEKDFGFLCYCLAPRRCMNERLMVVLAIRK